MKEFKTISLATQVFEKLEEDIITGDNITTDHIMPAGAKILPYRSNIPFLSKFCFEVCDPEFAQRAKATENGKLTAIAGSKTIALRCDLTDRQRKILLAGGLLRYIGEGGL